VDPWGAEQEVLADHLAEVVVRRLVDPLEILLGSSGDLRAEIAANSRAWAAQLLLPLLNSAAPSLDLGGAGA
jgi:hypothetical protein